MPDQNSDPPKKKKAAKKGPAELAENGDVLVVIGKSYRLAARPGVQVWNLEGKLPTEKGDRYAIARLSPAALFELGWVRRK